MRYQSLIIAALICTGLYSVPAMASTCPTQFYKDKSNFWVSDDPPGWRAHKKSAPNSTLLVNNFGGALYSINLKRIACVYRDSDGQWVALISSKEHPFNPDDLKTDTWRYIEKRNNYICGSPHRTLPECEFKINNEKIK